MKRLFIIFIFVLGFQTLRAQTVKVFISFERECWAYENRVFVSLQVNDSIKFEKFVTSEISEFNVPVFLIQNGFCAVKVRKITNDQLNGNPCDDESGLVDGLIYEDEAINSADMRSGRPVKVRISCGESINCTMGLRIRFAYNSSDIGASSFAADTIYKNKFMLYCYLDQMRRTLRDTLVITGLSYSNEKSSQALAVARASALKKLFVDYGFIPEKLIVAGSVSNDEKKENDATDIKFNFKRGAK